MKALYLTPLLATIVAGAMVAQALPTPAGAECGPARCRASQLIGFAITNSQNESLGEIRDIVVDGANRNIAYAVVRFGGVLGMGGKYFAVPWRFIDVTQRGSDETPRALLGLDERTLTAAPGFDKDDWPDMADAAWPRQVDDYYRRRSETEQPQGAAEPKGSAPDGTRGVDGPPGSVASLHRRLSRLIGMVVVDLQHKELAGVEDLVVDPTHAAIDGVLLSYGGVLGVGESLVLVPADALTLDHGKDVFVIACTRSDLEAMVPKDSKLPSLNDETWLTSGREKIAKAQKYLVPGNGDVPAVDASGAKSVRYADSYDHAAPVAIRGTIATVGTVRVGDGREQRARWRVRLAEGREVIVYGAPSSFAEQQALGLRAGSKIEVTGSTARYGSQTVLVAGTIAAGGKTATLRDEKGRALWLKE